MSLDLRLQPDQPALAAVPTPQVCYLLLTLAAEGRIAGQRAVNWALVADASRSMRIPIISEEQFRRLVREGGAHEVLVDGVPVWQFRAPVPADIDATSPTAMDYVMRALASVIEQMQPDDRFALVACAEEAELLAPGTPGTERGRLAQAVGRLKALDLGNETDLARGMQLALDDLRQGRERGAARVARLLLLTDGFTRQPETCLALARQAAAEGLSVSTLGLGGEFQEDVLTALADASGGRAAFVRHPEEIPTAVAHELAAARAVAAHAVTLRLELAAGVKLQRATSIAPTLATLEPLAAAPALQILRLGDLEPGHPAVVLLELLVPPDMPGERVRLARLRALSESPHTRSDRDVLATHTPRATALPPEVLDAAARANALHLQRRALDAAAHGEHHEAARLLRTVAARLRELGEADLAAVAQQESDNLEHTGQTTRMGAKELTYSTRRLGSRRDLNQ
jgi:Mg-chelatase subunit ChlD